MRWRYEQVDFEPGGIDHACPNGSYDTAKDISREILGYVPPMFQGYGFIGLKGLAGKMASSSGLNFTPKTLLRIYQPEVLLWLYARTELNKEFAFGLDDGILIHYHEFDRMLIESQSGEASELTKTIMEYCKALDKVFIPDSVVKIGRSAFVGCDNLKEIIINNPSLLHDANVPQNVVIKKPIYS